MEKAIDQVNQIKAILADKSQIPETCFPIPDII
jgi:hypothetical protein